MTTNLPRHLTRHEPPFCFDEHPSHNSGDRPFIQSLRSPPPLTHHVYSEVHPGLPFPCGHRSPLLRFHLSIEVSGAAADSTAPERSVWSRCFRGGSGSTRTTQRWGTRMQVGGGAAAAAAFALRGRRPGRGWRLCGGCATGKRQRRALAFRGRRDAAGRVGLPQAPQKEMLLPGRLRGR